MKLNALSDTHTKQIAKATVQALVQWLPEHAGLTPLEIVQKLDRVVLFLQQNGSPSTQAGQVTSLAFAWGMQVQRSTGWTWVNAEGDAGFNPALQSEDGAALCCPVDLVTELVMKRTPGSLTKLFHQFAGTSKRVDMQ